MTSLRSQIWFFFNELSGSVPAPTRHQGHRRMDDMVTAVATMMNGCSATIVEVREADLWTAELASGYTVADWLWKTERDRRRLLLNLATKNDFPAEADEALRDRFSLSEFILSQETEGKSGNRVEVRGLGAAYLFSGIGISLRSEDRWHQIQISLRYTWLDEDCQAKSNAVEALNLSETSQVEGLSDRLLERSRRDLQVDPLTLANRKHECFPHLVFGLDVDGQLDALPHEILRVACTKLLTLDAASHAWRRDPTMAFPDLPTCHNESEPTLQQYGYQRRFRDSEGEIALYSLHAMVGKKYRIHLRVIHEPRGIEIGYIGFHLDTVRHH